MKHSRKRIAQLIVVLLSALTLKQYYSTATPDDLRWILAPTTILVELITGTSFEFESHAGYLSGDHSFLIAGSCAGVNFLITAFLMLSLRKLWGDRSHQPSGNVAWSFIPIAAVSAYLATIIANTVRISTALHLKRTHLELGGMSANQLHRFEGIFVYFGFLLLLYVMSERMTACTRAGSEQVSALTSEKRPGSLQLFLFPLLIYYVTTLGIPLANGVFRGGFAATDFWQHSVFVLLTPLLVLLPLAAFKLAKKNTMRARELPGVRRLGAAWVRAGFASRLFRRLSTRTSC